jgi:hypothetical protein
VAPSEETREAIVIHAATREQADRLAEAIDKRFEVAVIPGGSYAVEVTPDAETRERLVGLFDAIGSWLTDGGMSSTQIGFGSGALTVLPATREEPSDPTQFLLERNRQLEQALSSRVVIEQAKGILAGRLGIGIDEAFRLLRGAARNARREIHEVAADVVAGTLDLSK